MNNEEIWDLWEKYIGKTVKYSPHPFSKPNCTTCTYWHLVDEDTLEMISIHSPKEHEAICRGMAGEVRGYKEDGQIVDSYVDHLFYGFCKRFPPTWPESNSITYMGLFFGLFKRTNVKKPEMLAGYRFPFLPHNEVCGEWKQAEWVREALSKNR